MLKLIVRPDELKVSSKLYGPGSESINEIVYSANVKRRANFKAVIEKYRGSQQNIDHMEWLKSNPQPIGSCQLTLTPTYFWYDNVHIVETKHYRDFIFDPKHSMIAKGGFVEDKLSPIIKRTVGKVSTQNQLFLLYDYDDIKGPRDSKLGSFEPDINFILLH